MSGRVYSIQWERDEEDRREDLGRQQPHERKVNLLFHYTVLDITTQEADKWTKPVHEATLQDLLMVKYVVICFGPSVMLGKFDSLKTQRVIFNTSRSY